MEEKKGLRVWNSLTAINKIITNKRCKILLLFYDQYSIFQKDHQIWIILYHCYIDILPSWAYSKKQAKFFNWWKIDGNRTLKICTAQSSETCKFEIVVHDFWLSNSASPCILLDILAASMATINDPYPLYFRIYHQSKTQAVNMKLIVFEV